MTLSKSKAFLQHTNPQITTGLTNNSIGNLASAKFTASYFGIPLSKDSAHDDDSFTVQEVFDIHSHLFEYVFLDIDLAKSYKHRVLAQNDAQKLAKTVQAAIHSAESFTGMIMSEIENHTGPSLPDFGRALIKRLLKNKSKEDLVWEMIPTQAGAVATLAQGVLYALSPTLFEHPN